MALIKPVGVRISVDGFDSAESKIKLLTEAANKLGDEKPTIKPEIDTAQALLKARILGAGIRAELAKAVNDAGKVANDASSAAAGGSSGIFGSLFSSVSSGGLGPLPAALSSPPALAAITVAAGAALVEITGLVSGFAAAAAGLAAFGAVAYPTFTALSAGLTALSTATTNYQAASQTLDVAIRKSPADLKAYQATIHGLEPDLQNAAKLLTNQNVVWQALSPSQQASVIALSNNSAALKLLLPDQKTALTALLAERTAWDNLTPSQQKAANSLNQLGNSYQKVVTALQPTVMKVFNDALKAVVNVLPALQPLAQTAGTAIDGLLKQFDKFTASAGFRGWIKQISDIAGPAITAFGDGIGKVIGQAGKLLTILSSKDDVRAIGIVMDSIAGLIRFVGLTILAVSKTWDFFELAALGAFGKIINGAAKAFAWVPGLGPLLQKSAAAFDNWEKGILGGLTTIQGVAGITANSVAAVGFAATNALNQAALLKGLVPPGARPGLNHPAVNAASLAGTGLVQAASPLTVNYHINVGAAANPAEAGRQIIGAIRAWELKNGKSWRKL